MVHELGQIQQSVQHVAGQGVAHEHLLKHPDKLAFHIRFQLRKPVGPNQIWLLHKTSLTGR
jgi:hypothetical protein